MSIPSGLVPTRVTELPAYVGSDGSGTIMYILNGCTYQTALSAVIGIAAVPSARQVIAGTGLSGGGALSSDVTVSATYSATAPAALGAAGAGAASTLARSDHIHPAVTLSDTSQTSGALPLTRGGTGQVTAAAARVGLLPALASNAGKVLTVNVGETDAEWTAIAGSGTVTSINASGGTTGLTFSGGPVTASGTLTAGGTLAVANGGTGQTSYTNGQLLIGNTTGNTLAKATLTAGTGITITNGGGSITVASTVVGLSDGDKGDIAVSSSGTVWTIDNSVVSYAKMQNVSATDKLLGRSTAGAGVVEEIACTAAGRALLDDATAADQRTTLGLGTIATLAAPGGTVVGTTDTQTLTNKTLTDPALVGCILEDVYTISDGAAFEVDPGNGGVQLVTLGASRTPKATNFAAGESVTFMVDDGTAYALTWNDATWGGSGVVWKTNGGVAPTLNTTGYTAIVLWKVGSQVYGARVGDA